MSIKLERKEVARIPTVEYLLPADPLNVKAINANLPTTKGASLRKKDYPL